MYIQYLPQLPRILTHGLSTSSISIAKLSVLIVDLFFVIVFVLLKRKTLFMVGKVGEVSITLLVYTCCV
jgi:hypothetical protein